MLAHFIKIAYREAYTKASTDSFGIKIRVHFDRFAICGGLSIYLPDRQFYQNALAFCKIAYRQGILRGAGAP